jgi:hypothetical protein
MWTKGIRVYCFETWDAWFAKAVQKSNGVCVDTKPPSAPFSSISLRLETVLKLLRQTWRFQTIFKTTPALCKRIVSSSELYVNWNYNSGGIELSRQCVLVFVSSMSRNTQHWTLRCIWNWSYWKTLFGVEISRP